MDVRTALTLKRHEHKQARRALAGANVNDMRSSCQGGAGPFPPTYNCAPCNGPRRQQQWGGAYSIADFGGRVPLPGCDEGGGRPRGRPPAPLPHPPPQRPPMSIAQQLRPTMGIAQQVLRHAPAAFAPQRGAVPMSPLATAIAFAGVLR